MKCEIIVITRSLLGKFGNFAYSAILVVRFVQRTASDAFVCFFLFFHLAV